MMMPEPDVEILVHISAPSLALDDAHYRELAVAYLNFEQARTTRLEDSPPPATTPTRPPLFGSLESPLLSFEGALDNVRSPVVRQRQVGDDGGRMAASECQESWEAPPSTVGDSQPYNDISFEGFCNPDRVIEYQLDKLDRLDKLGRAVSTPAVINLDSSPGEKSQIRGESSFPPSASSRRSDSAHDIGPVCSGAWRKDPSVEVPSSLPTAPRRSQRIAASQEGRELGIPSSNKIVPSSLVDKTSSPPLLPRLPSPAPDNRQDAQSRPSETRQIIEVPSSPPILCSRNPKDLDVSFGTVITCSDRTGSEPPAAKRPRRTPPLEARQSAKRSASVAEARPGRRNSGELAPRAKWLDTLEVFGPEPPVSIRHITPDDLLTPHLRKLHSDLGKAKRYEARVLQQQDKGPEPFERGWWILDCSELGDRRLTAWEYLARYVHVGNAGWGVSLMRESAATARIRLFSYGHLAAHMYLLLYMASERRIYEVDCTWTSARRGDLLFVPAIGGR